MLANISQSHMKVFNRVLNGISSRSGNDVTRSNVHTRTRTHTLSTPSSSTAEKKKASLDTTRKKRSVSHCGNLNASRGGGGVRL